jgi:hypothetical protein
MLGKCLLVNYIPSSRVNLQNTNVHEKPWVEPTNLSSGFLKVCLCVWGGSENGKRNFFHSFYFDVKVLPENSCVKCMGICMCLSLTLWLLRSHFRISGPFGFLLEVLFFIRFSSFVICNTSKFRKHLTKCLPQNSESLADKFNLYTLDYFWLCLNIIKEV